MINFDERIIDIFSKRAKDNFIDTINIGLGYTAVVLKNNCCGVCCTLVDSQKSCTVYKGERDFEGECCYDLLITLKGEKDNISRAVIIAMVNALSQSSNIKFEDGKNLLSTNLKLNPNDKLAMIGYFKPIVNQLEKQSISVKSYDIGKGIGNEDEFYKFVNEEASALIITATSFINNTFFSIYDRVKLFNKPIAVLGPSTIMEQSLYENTPVTILGGTFVQNNEGVLKAIRNGKGTHQIHKFSKKVYLTL